MGEGLKRARDAARATQNQAICANCQRRIFRAVNGDWYHRHNASVSCYPGEGLPERAEPEA